MKINNFKIGSDIEVFIKDENSGKYISAAGDATNEFAPLVPGTKYAPHYIDDEGHKAVETDNVSVEFLIKPTTELVEFRQQILDMVQHIREILPVGYIPVAEASAVFDNDQLMTEQAKTFGCEPDLNAWTRRVNKKPNINTNIRSNGFHIHIGYDNPNLNTSIELIRAMDLYLGAPSVISDNDVRRRSLYGKAGSFRIKPYGVEYRVLSSFMISQPNLIDFAFNGTLNAIEFINKGLTVEPDVLGNKIQKAINNSNRIMAANVMEQFNKEYSTEKV